MDKREVFVIEVNDVPQRIYRKQGTANGVLKRWSKYYDVSNYRVVKYVPEEDAIKR